MKKILIPVVMLVVGLGGGAGAAWVIATFLSAPPEAADAGAGPVAESTPPADGAPADEAHGTETPPSPSDGAGDPAVPEDAEFLRLNDQFMVPLVRGDRVAALVVITLGLEIGAGQSEAVRSREPRLRALLLQTLFDHANTGAFEGMFTASSNMRILRESLTRAAQEVSGDTIRAVLVLDIVRQDM